MPVRLLVVDDDIAVRMQVTMALDDVEVIEAWRAASVVDDATREAVDAVIIDRRLPDADGLRAVRALRNDTAKADVPIVVITASDDAQERLQAFAAGADEHVVKPIEPVRLVALVRALLATPASERRIRRMLHRARLHVGRDDGGHADLLPTPPVVDLVADAPRRRWRVKTG